MSACCWGVMNWPLKPGWKCKFCGTNGLLWGLPHAEAHCYTCHAVWYMRDGDKILTEPKCGIKPEFGDAWLKIPETNRKPMNQMTEDEWNEALAAAKES